MTDPGSTGPFLPYAVAAVVTMFVALPLLLAACAVLWYRVLLPALLRGDDNLAEAVDELDSYRLERR